MPSEPKSKNYLQKMAQDFARPKVLAWTAILAGTILAGAVVFMLCLNWSIATQKRYGTASNKIITPKEQFDIEKDTLDTYVKILQGIGSLGFIITAYVSFQTLKATQKNVQISEKNTYISQEKQVTERFTQAINQLGSDKVEVRLGGIYALERIAKDSPEDHWNIVEVLSSFIREKSPASTKETVSSPAIDVQATLTVLGRRKTDSELPEQYINLERTNLNGVRLRKANFSRSRLTDSSFRGAEISESDFSKMVALPVDFQSVKFITVDFSKAMLLGSTFHGSSFMEIKFIEAHLYGVDFRNTLFAHPSFEKIFAEGKVLMGSIFGQNQGLSKEIRAKMKSCGATFTDLNDLGDPTV